MRKLVSHYSNVGLFLQTKRQPILGKQGDYEAMLLSLPEQQRRQLLEGDWDIKEGAAFTEFDRNVHVVEPLPYS